MKVKADKADKATSTLLKLLPNNDLNDEHPLTRDESQKLHKRTNMDKVYDSQIVPANAFWVLCITGECLKLDLCGRQSIRYCAWRATHLKIYHKDVPQDNCKCIIHSYFDFDKEGCGWGTEYKQLEEIKKHSYKYYGGDLIELIIDENGDESEESCEESSDNGSESEVNNLTGAIADAVMTKLDPKMSEIKAVCKSSRMGGFFGNNNNNSIKGKNINTNIYALRVEAKNFVDFVENEANGVFELLLLPNAEMRRVLCNPCHRFRPSKLVWSKGKDMTVAEASDRAYVSCFVLFCLILFFFFCFVFVLFVLYCFVLFLYRLNWCVCIYLVCSSARLQAFPLILFLILFCFCFVCI